MSLRRANHEIVVTLDSLLRDPLEGKTSLAKVVWIYGLLGSLLYGALELFLDPTDQTQMRVYSVGGLLLTAYVAVATYRCAGNSSSRFWARMARVSAVVSILLLPLLAYLEFSGVLSLALMGSSESGAIRSSKGVALWHLVREASFGVPLARRIDSGRSISA